MKMNQRKAGVLLAYAGELVKILTALIYTPVMLRLLGQSEYGLYQLVYSVVSYLGLLSLGFGSSYMRFYSGYKAKRDENGIARLNAMFAIIFCSISVLCIICGLIMLGNINNIFGSGLNDTELDKARVLMALMVVNLAITFPKSIFNCYITAYEKFFFQRFLDLFQNLLNPFLTFPLLLMGMGSVGIVVITTILTVMTLIGDMMFCIKRLHIRFLFKELHFSLLKEMWEFTFFIFLNQIVDQINWNVDKLLLGRLAGTATVAVYGVGSQINSMYLQTSIAVSSVFIPKVNKIVAESGSDGELTTLFTKVGRIQFIIMSLILTSFIFFGRPFMRFWAGKGYDAAYYVTLLLIIPVTVPLIQNLGIEIQRAKNRHRVRSAAYFCTAIANVLISIPLIKLWGSIGAALGTAITLVFGNILYINWYYHSRIGLNMIHFWKNILKFIPALVVPCLLGTIMMRFLSFNNLMVLAIGIGIYITVFAVSMWFGGMNKEEKALFSGPLIRLMRKSKI